MGILSLIVLQASLREEKKLRVENAKLKKEIEVLKQQLIQAEIRNGGNWNRIKGEYLPYTITASFTFL